MNMDGYNKQKTEKNGHKPTIDFWNWILKNENKVAQILKFFFGVIGILIVFNGF